MRRANPGRDAPAPALAERPGGGGVKSWCGRTLQVVLGVLLYAGVAHAVPDLELDVVLDRQRRVSGERRYFAIC